MDARTDFRHSWGEQSIATLNGLEMVREPLKGTLGHTFKDLEVIVVDDGPDPSLQLETQGGSAAPNVLCWSVVAADRGRFRRCKP